jgi:hypothetical protein
MRLFEYLLKKIYEKNTDNLHTFFFPLLHTLDHEVGIVVCLG